MRRRAARDRLNETEAAFYLGFDIIQLAALLFVTGGLGNPFALLLLAPVTVSATILGRRSPIRLCLLALACATDRKGVVRGKRVSVRVDLGGRRLIKKKK